MVSRTPSTISPGLIFLSHSSKDKDYIESVIRLMPQSHIFYDTKTINPGQHTIEALEDGLLISDVFVLFVSPNTPLSCWVDYETSTALFLKVRKQHIRILVCPIKGATFHDAPKWMQNYSAIPTEYYPSDVARCIQYSYQASLEAQGLIKPSIFVGREALANKMIVASRTRSAETGVAPNVLILAGIQNMGRLTLAKRTIPSIFPGSRSDLPIITLPDYADSIEFLLALRNDIGGGLSKSEIAKHISEFTACTPKEQADVLTANLNHFGQINQTVIVRSAYGLRHRAPDLKEWLQHVFENLRDRPNIRLVWISERLLASERVAQYPNVLQFRVDELDNDSIFYLLTEILGSTNMPPDLLQRLSSLIQGHPATAHYVAHLVNNSQRSIESIIARPEVVQAFQDKCVWGILDVDVIGNVGLKVLHILSLLPSADFNLLSEIVTEISSADLAQVLADLTDDCIVSYNMSSGYRIPQIVRSSFGRRDVVNPPDLLTSIADALSSRLHDEQTTVYTIEALIHVSVLKEGKLPEELQSVVTGSTLQDIVEHQYQMGFRYSGDWTKGFERASRFALLADVIPMPYDTRESIMFRGADSMIRLGQEPTSLVEKMKQYGFPSTNYILGSYNHFVLRNNDEAIIHLERAFAEKSFILRTAKLLAKLYLGVGQADKSLEVFEMIGEKRVNRDSGLLAQKIRSLRAASRYEEAGRLMGLLRTMDDDHGEFEMIRAAQLMREGQYKQALTVLASAKSKPKINRASVRLLETAIKIENNDYSDLDATCEFALSIGRSDDAASLKARAALRRDDWRGAEIEIQKIGKLNLF